MALYRFHIPDMDCASEVRALEEALQGIVGIRRLRFDLVGRRLTVACDGEDPSPESVLARIRTTGLRAELAAATVVGDHPEDARRRWATVLSGVLFGIGGAVHLATVGVEAAPTIPAILLYAAAILIGGAYIAPRAWRAARALRADMNVLMTLAVAGAVAIGQWPEAAAVAFLFCLAQWLDTWSVSRARRAVSTLVELAPTTACVIARFDAATAAARPVPESRVPVGDIAVGDVILVRPGEAIAADGRVRSGTSHVDQSPITGESVPAAKGPEAEVFAGSINGEGALEVVVARDASDSTLARIALLVEEAQARRAPVERWVDRFAHVYTPAVVLLALGIALVPPLGWDASWKESLYRALVLLVISCPCALVISTPVSLAAALAAAAHRGVLVKGGEFLETMTRLRALALDKTGTLTYGNPEVVETVSLETHSEREVLERAASLEGASEHPLARAILRRSRELGIDVQRAEGFQVERGLGATGSWNGRPFWVGGRRLLERRGQGTPAVHGVVERMEQAGRTVVLVGNDSHVCGAVAVADRVRSETVGAIDEVRRLGIEHVVMLTGDHRTTAQAIAGESGITEVLPDLLPDQKVKAVRDLVDRYGTIAMIGDGINDAPALAAASIGIAMGGTGTAAALETADVVLMHDDLRQVSWLIRHARRTFLVVRMNIALSLVVKLAFLLLALPGIATLWMAIAADMGASLAVIGNGLRLLREPRSGASGASGAGRSPGAGGGAEPGLPESTPGAPRGAPAA